MTPKRFHRKLEPLRHPAPDLIDQHDLGDWLVLIGMVALCVWLAWAYGGSIL